MTGDYEIAIVGAGLSGACAAALLARHAGIEPGRIALLTPELPSPPPPPGAPPDLRVVAISRASERVLQSAGAWPAGLQPRLCAYERMVVWHASSQADGPEALHFDAADIGEPNLGYIAENQALLRACIDSFRAAGGSIVEAQLQASSLQSQQVRLTLRGGRELTARLLIGADGAQSLVRAGAGLAVRRFEYRELAIVANVATATAHGCTARQRFLPSGPLALLPLFDGSSSIVWSIEQALAPALLDGTPEQFNQRLEAAADGVLGSMRLCSERRSFPLRSVAAASYVTARCALIGDAAHVVHPLAGQGANLGLLDAAALCEAVAAAVAEREDVGALRTLRSYEQQRRTHNLLMDAALSALHAGFGSAGGAAAWLINRSLAAVNRSGPVKRAFARRALGTVGELPRLARAPLRDASAS